MKNNSIHSIVEKQRNFFNTHTTLDINWRIDQLIRLKIAVQTYEKEIMQALHEDLGRCETEAYLTDIGPLILEINEAIAHTKKWAKPEVHFSGIQCFPSVITKVFKMPYGVTLIMSPFNFPILLTLGVLAASISAGNTAVLKTSSKSAHCTAVMKKLIESTFDEKYVALIDGGHDVADACLAERFDKIFYTGSPTVGRHVMHAAAENLTPVALELGGENGNWCIIRKDADIKDAAKKIAFFKACNSGQICININQIAIEKSIAEPFIKELKKAFTKQLGTTPHANKEYAHLITEQAYDNCANEAETYKDRIVFGGSGNRETLRFDPTIIFPVQIDEPIVNHELFNPLLPIVPYDNEEALLETIASREHGLALYIFTQDTKWAENVMSTLQYGGGCINEVCMHLMVRGVPFNGTGHSGMGAYHGEWGFREFTHPSTVLYGSTKFNLPLRNHPYKSYKKVLLKLFER